MGIIKKFKTNFEIGKQRAKAEVAVRYKQQDCKIAGSLFLGLGELAKSLNDSEEKLNRLIEADIDVSDDFVKYFSTAEDILGREVDVCQLLISETGCMAQLSVVSASVGRQVLLNCVCPNFQPSIKM